MTEREDALTRDASAGAAASARSRQAGAAPGTGTRRRLVDATRSPNAGRGDAAPSGERRGRATGAPAPHEADAPPTGDGAAAFERERRTGAAPTQARAPTTDAREADSGVATTRLPADPAPRPATVAPGEGGAVSTRTRPPARWATARVTRRTALRVRPGGRVLARLGTRTEFGSPRVLGVVRRRGDWLQVVATERRAGRPGWIEASAARLDATDVSIHVDRSARRLVLRRGKRVVVRMPVAVGRPGTETPLGRFAVTDKLRPQRPNSPYGCCAIALSGHQPKLLPGWPGGDRLAIHATPNVETVGTAASLGCLRGHPRDLRRLMRIVPLGAPVFVRA